MKQEWERREALRAEPDLSLIVADKHGGVALHDGRRQSLEVAPEVTEGHVLRVTCTEQAEASVSSLGQCSILHSSARGGSCAPGNGSVAFFVFFFSLARSNLHCFPWHSSIGGFPIKDGLKSRG